MESKLLVSAVERLRVPALSEQQVTALAALHRELVAAEQSHLNVSVVSKWDDPRPDEELQAEMQERIDAEVEGILGIPQSVGILAREFMGVRYQFNKGKSGISAVQPPTNEQLHVYAERLREELDGFARSHHRITVVRGPNLIVSKIEITRSREPIEVSVEAVPDSLTSPYRALWTDLKHQRSQWVYVQRALRLFEGAKVHLFKSPRLVDWTQTQALLDADDLIAEVLNRELGKDGSQLVAGPSMV
jgi:hypothetical protein